jgi:hypothetical protein
MHAPNNRNSRLRDKPLNRREVRRECHLLNNEICQALETIYKRLFAAGFFSYSGGILIGLETDAERKQVGEEAFREGVRLTEETLELLRDLIVKWPNAAYLFFPDEGHMGLVRLIRQFYTQVFPPGIPHRVQLKTHCMSNNNMWCGRPERLRLEETTRALNIWKEFKDGRSPIEIARRAMTRERGPRKSLRAAQMMVSRSLQRARILIYGRPQLGGFDVATHMQHCRRCNTGKLCQEAEDYANLEYGSQRDQFKSDDWWRKC